jgi:hypothetical protein
MAYGKNSIIRPIDMKQEYSVQLSTKSNTIITRMFHDIIQNKPNRMGSLLPDMS